MSADNGIYLHHFENGWRVVHGQCIENICYKPDKDGYNQKELKRYFAESPLLKTEDEAWKYARKLYKEVLDDFGHTEYGIQVV
jgi:hypothetical protein